MRVSGFHKILQGLWALRFHRVPQSSARIPHGFHKAPQCSTKDPISFAEFGGNLLTA